MSLSAPDASTPKAARITVPELHTAHGPPVFTAAFKAQPADFQVDEVLPFSFTGDGEHLYLRLVKTDRNTSDVVKALKRCYQVVQKDIGTAGLKDKRAVTTQWFSIRTPLDETPLARWLDSPDAPPFELVESHRHQRKLRTGAHSANRFVITLRDVLMLDNTSADVSVSNTAAPDTHQQGMQNRLQTLVENGFPNYFGPQRFGRHGVNLTQAYHWLCAGKKPGSMARDKRSLYLSAVRSAAFNRIVAARVQLGNWNTLRAGEACALNGSNSVFALNDADRAEALQRLNDNDIHPTAPLIGSGDWVSVGEAREHDETLLSQDEYYPQLLHSLKLLRVDASQRATRALCADLTAQWLDDQTLQLSVTLAPGVFATALLNELFRE
jgi:tRNA pseudouridine13 synthase